MGVEQMTRKLPLVSVIIPAYNSRRWVCDAIDSILQQTYQSLEVIVIDDGSTDGTGELLQGRYGNSIRYVYQSNMGLPCARNAGIALAKGRYVQFLDADDLLLPNKIELQVAALQKDTQYSVAYSPFVWLMEGGVRVAPGMLRKKAPSGDIWSALLRGNFIVVHAALSRLDIIKEVGGFNEALRACEDYDLWLRLSARGAMFLYTPDVGVLYRRTANSMSSNTLRQIRGNLLVLGKARNQRIFNWLAWYNYLVQTIWLRLYGTFSSIRDFGLRNDGRRSWGGRFT